MKIVKSSFKGPYAEILVQTGLHGSSELVSFGPFGPMLHEVLKDPIVANVDLAIEEISKQCGAADVEVRAAILHHLTANDNPL
ncbi:hypothetical protein [Neorhizobium sp. JUb45]|uniref:hypothetical protein n=1 Tax=Neorhizobium sp. JUb45 TaxID=2485113 RepID=UPI001045B7D1|nr:hypothetical protein [Neorhizobium sp. JUb45]TCR07295.1 hypothetical protein EDF70_1011268 [Neorhizobium sp. JUb45]